jgi:hypothetical protein
MLGWWKKKHQFLIKGGVKVLPFLTGFIYNQPAGMLELF